MEQNLKSNVTNPLVHLKRNKTQKEIRGTKERKDSSGNQNAKWKIEAVQLQKEINSTYS